MLQAKYREIKARMNLKIRATFQIRKVITLLRVKILKRKLRYLRSAMIIIKI